MRPQPPDFAALAQDTALAPFLRAGVAVILWAQDGRRVLWASDAARPLIAALAPDNNLASHQALSHHLAVLAADPSVKRGIKLAKLELDAAGGRSITCACQAVTLADGETGLMTAIVGRLPVPTPDTPEDVSAGEPVAEQPASAAAASDEHSADTGSAVETEAAALAALADRASARPRWRFTFATDETGRITRISPEFAAALGPFAGTDPTGHSWSEFTAGRLAGDPAALAQLASSATFSLRDTVLRLGKTDEAVVFDLSGVAGRGPDGAFLGHRGFGVIHLADRRPWVTVPDAGPLPEVPAAFEPQDEQASDVPAEPPVGAPLPADASARVLANVTARLRDWASPPATPQVTAGWAENDRPASRRGRDAGHADRRVADTNNALEAWATGAIARFGETMAANDRMVADMRSRLRENEPSATPAPEIPPIEASARDALSDSDRQALREIARALGQRNVSGTEPQPPSAPSVIDNEAAPRVAEQRPQEHLRLVVDEPAARPAAAVPEAEASPDMPLPAMQRQLAQREAELRELGSILDTATDGVVVIDERGRILSLNRSAEALFGYDQKEVTGDPFTLLLATESHPLALDYLEGLRSNGVASILNDGREVFGRVRQGGRIPLFMTIGRIADGPERKFCAVLRDMTAWKKAEADLTEAKRAAERANAQKSDFLATISHEIRTPLNAIIGFAEMMLEERFGPVGNERYKDYLRDIHASGGHVISLVNDLLDLAKIEAGRLELDFVSVDVNDIVRGCASLLQAQANRSRVVLRMSLAPGLPPVVADARSLRQIVLNVLSNAVKFTDAGGQVIVSTALTDRGELALRVRDTGIGMSDAEIKAALEPFRQLATSRRQGGTGLGLPLTKALVEANRGAFAITSAKSEGTLVEVLFPPTRVLAG